MTSITVAGEELPIRAELLAAIKVGHRRLTEPGTWWTGAQRAAIAAEARHAKSCSLCQQRQSALSPYTVAGEHDSLGELDRDVVEAVHRLSTDAGRITESWVKDITSRGLSEEAYVEIIGIIALLTGLDTFNDALGRERDPLPPSQTGEPRRYRPNGAKHNLAWVATLSPEDAQPQDPDPFVIHGKANIHRGISLVPQEVINFFDLDVELYIHDTQIRDFGNSPRAINRAQIELIAGRASSINNCEY
jgi:alkylhydroperoxidase family enzyme